MDHTNFDNYRNTIASLDLSDGSVWPQSIRMRNDGDWATYYAPFEYVNPSARIAIVGITPGLKQAVNALKSAQSSIRAGHSTSEALSRAKAFASFSGAMRSNLTSMLDHIGVAQWLGLDSTTDLFAGRPSLAHFSSVLRYPVTYRGENYGGNPSILREAFTRHELDTWFKTEIRDLPAAVFVPLGPAVTEVFEWRVACGVLSADRVLSGLPHPSGANAERITYFLQRKARDRLSKKVNPDRIDHLRIVLSRRVQELRS